MTLVDAWSSARTVAGLDFRAKCLGATLIPLGLLNELRCTLGTFDPGQIRVAYLPMTSREMGPRMHSESARQV